MDEYSDTMNSIYVLIFLSYHENLNKDISTAQSSSSFKNEPKSNLVHAFSETPEVLLYPTFHLCKEKKLFKEHLIKLHYIYLHFKLEIYT